MTTHIENSLLVTVKLGIFLVLLTPLVVTPDTIFPFVVGKAIYARALIEVTFVCWAVLAVRNSKYRPAHSWILVLFGAYLAISLIAAMLGVSFLRSFWGDYRRMGGVFDLAHWVVFAIVLASVFRNSKQWWWLLNANLGVSLLVTLIGLAQRYDIGVLWYLQTTERLGITFGNATYVGAYTLVNGLIALAFLARPIRSSPDTSQGRVARAKKMRNRERRHSFLRWRVFWATTAGLNFWVLTLSGTRGAALGLVFGLLIVGVAYVLWGNRRRLKLLVGAIFVSLILVSLAAPLARDTALFRDLARSNPLVNRFDRIVVLGLEDPSIKSRLSISRDGLKGFAHSPLLGWGPENFQVAFDRYVEEKDLQGAEIVRADQAHNKLVEELVTKGILGFSVYALLLGRAAWVLARISRKESQDRWFTIFVGCAMTGYLVQNLFLFDTPGTLLQFVLLLGWVAHKEGQLGGGFRFRQSRVRDIAGTGLPKGQRGMGAPIARSFDWVLVMSTFYALIFGGISLYFFSYKPFSAAERFPAEASDFGEFLQDARKSFNTFPPLAAIGREALFDTFDRNWDRLNQQGQALFLRELQVEAKAALRAEPQNARTYLILASIHQRAAEADPSHFLAARQFVEMAQKRAPGLRRTTELSVSLELAEGNYSEALQAIFEFAGDDPTLLRVFSQQMQESQKELIGATGMYEYRCRWEGKETLTLEQRERLLCQRPTPSASLLLWLPLDEGSGIALRDRGHLKITCRIRGAKWVAGSKNYGLGFDGIDDFVSCDDNTGLDMIDEITVAAWVDSRSWSAQRHPMIVSKDFMGGWRLWKSDGEGDHDEKFALRIGRDAAYGTTTVQDDALYHVVGTYNGAIARIYVNGVLEGTKVLFHRLPTTQGAIHVGAGAEPDPSHFLSGTISSVRIYNLALDAEQIATLYASGQ